MIIDGNGHREEGAYLCAGQVALLRCQHLEVLRELWRSKALDPKTKTGHHQLFTLNQGCLAQITDLRCWEDKQNADSWQGRFMAKGDFQAQPREATQKR